jgi:hypothetical protein
MYSPGGCEFLFSSDRRGQEKNQISMPNPVGTYSTVSPRVHKFSRAQPHTVYIIKETIKISVPSLTGTYNESPGVDTLRFSFRRVTRRKTISLCPTPYLITARIFSRKDI